MAGSRPGAPHVTADFTGLPSRATDNLLTVMRAYPVLESGILRALGQPTPEARARAVQSLFLRFERGATGRLQVFLRVALPVFTREAENALSVAASRVISRDVEASLLTQLRAQVFGPDREAAARILAGIAQGLEGDELKALAYGFKRSDGSLIGIAEAGQARIRTAVNAIQAESHLSRYKASRVRQVQFSAGGRCTYKGLGGTCTDLDGSVFPIDGIPDWARIPRHPYSNSRWLPYIDIPGVDTGGPAAKSPLSV